MNRRTVSLLLLLITALLLTLGATTSAATAQSSEALWFVSYWDNPDLEGEPAHTSSEGVIDHDWGHGSPHGSIGGDTWSARWTSFVNFAPGTYRFTASSDDGVRIYLGDKHILADWSSHPLRTTTALVSLTGGSYPVAVDYFEDVGRARLKVGWERTGAPVSGAADVTVLSSGPAPTPAPPTSVWQAAYWNNRFLDGNPALSRHEAMGAINYNWGGGAPVSGIQADNFSARWTRSLDLIPGRYRFTVTSDDGARLWVNNRLLIDRWQDQPAQTYSAEIDLAGGPVPVRLDYYEHGGLAQISLNWTRIGSAGQTGGGEATAFVNTYWLNVRTGPGIEHSRITAVPRGTEVTLLARNDDASWVYASLPDGTRGWMSAFYLASNLKPFTFLPEVEG